MKSILLDTYPVSVNKKGRTYIPAALRKYLPERLIVIRISEIEDSCSYLILCPEEIAEQVTKEEPSVIENWYETRIDNNGMVYLGIRNIRHINSPLKGILIGRGNHIELWSLDTWNEWYQRRKYLERYQADLLKQKV